MLKFSSPRTKCLTFLLFLIINTLIPYLFHCPYKRLNSSSEIYPYSTDSSEKVVIAISLARIYVNNVAPISVNVCLVPT